ncbi:uncharacterized protein LOC119448592 [Dermacentor silvarum]|uniref:uncharacterized protein LOC119448592 n=1 Tax=Dermacentor silvarum TaxID=543639 RepID=UPI002100ADD1|nr:uncharacterized protein LOC119448592 [Dermacentor silvarum]
MPAGPYKWSFQDDYSDLDLARWEHDRLREYVPETLPAEPQSMKTTQRPCALLLALIWFFAGPWRLLHQYVGAYDPCVYPGAHLEAMFRCAMKSMPDGVKAEANAILNRIPGLQLREVVDLMCKANRQSGTVMYEEFLSELKEEDQEPTNTAVKNCLSGVNKEFGFA